MCKWLTLRKGFYTMLLLSTRLVEVAGCPAPRPPAPVSSLLLRDLVRRLRPQSGDDKRHAVRPLHLSLAATCDVVARPVLITLSQSPDPREHRASSQLIIAITVSFVARRLQWAFADGSWTPTSFFESGELRTSPGSVWSAGLSEAIRLSQALLLTCMPDCQTPAARLRAGPAGLPGTRGAAEGWRAAFCMPRIRPAPAGPGDGQASASGSAAKSVWSAHGVPRTVCSLVHATPT